MKKVSLNETLNCTYRVIDKEVISIKSSVISICSDIDRYFRLKFNFNISNDELDIDKYFEIINEFPSLKGLLLSQFRHLLMVFTNIRDLSAHLHLCRDVEIHDDLKNYLIKIIKPKYDISINGKLTAYGQAFILSFLSQKYNLWNFYTTYFKRTHFIEMYNMSGKEVSSFQTNEQHLMQKYCGIGKPINTTSCSNIEYQYLNNLLKKHMTDIIFNLEKECSNTRKSKNKAKSLSRYLNSSYEFDLDDESYKLSIILRNSWFHGVMLDECMNCNNENSLLSFEFVMNSLIKIKSTLKRNESKFYNSIVSINEFANAILNFYVLRLVELSYKILDSRLLTEDKVESRIKQLSNAYNRLIDTDTSYLHLAGRLIDPEYMEYRVAGAKFLDNLTRTTICENLKIIKLHSYNGFEIGDFKTEKQDLFIVLVDLDLKYQNKINGINLNDYTLDTENKLGSKISVFEYSENIILNKTQNFIPSLL